MTKKTDLQHLFSIPVIVAALGYFVDIYDLLLFGIVRIPSLTSMGLNEEQLSVQGASILNWQMTGLLLGGILWGVMGDKKGRLSVLFGSILTIHWLISHVEWYRHQNSTRFYDLLPV